MNRAFAFAPPHRLTLSRPQAGDKTLVDVCPEKMTLTWSYESLKDTPVNVWRAPRVEWGFQITFFENGRPVNLSDWQRLDRTLPGILAHAGAVQIEALAARDRDILRFTLSPAEDTDFEIVCFHHLGGWVISNPAWIDGQNPNVLECMQGETPDRLLAVGLGADEYPLSLPKETKNEIPVPLSTCSASENPARTLTLRRHVKAGQSAVMYLLRPYRSYGRDLETLLTRDPDKDLEEARREWLDILNQGARIDIGSELTSDFYACLADLYVMREEDGEGHLVTSPGTQVYRSTNVSESGRTIETLLRLGLPESALSELDFHVRIQGSDGNWNDPLGWGHHIWSNPGFKAETIMEAYALYRDRDMLRKYFPYMLASSRWNDRMRRRTLADPNPLYRGLLPRGMGDCGMTNDGDYFGVFYPHNFYAIYSDRLAMEAARELGLEDEFRELSSIHSSALEWIRASLKNGCLYEDGIPFIPGVPGKAGGSTYGVLTAHYPCGILEDTDPILQGTYRHVEKHLSAGGQPIGNGWMKDGCWVAMALDNLAQAHLAAGRGEKASRYLISSLQYASPLVTWCEERGHEAGSTSTSGDLQHLWTPASVTMYITSAIAHLSDAGELCLLDGLPGECMKEGRIRIEGLRTPRGSLDLSVTRTDPEHLSIVLRGIPSARLKLLMPDESLFAEITGVQNADASLDNGTLILGNIRSRCQVTLRLTVPAERRKS